jgi:hypothetical protein
MLLCAVGMLVFSSDSLADMDDIKTEVRFLYVQPGQTLHNIVRRLYPGQEALWPQIRKEIVHLNQSSFINGDEASMKAGVRLTLPGKDKPKHALKRVGDVVQVQGQVLAVGVDKVSRKLVAGDGVFVGDKLITGETGFLRLAMIDNAKLDLRCFTIMVIEEYALQHADRRSILKVLQGSIRKITGEIGKMSDDIYELQTPVASVGVRGTEYALRVFQSKGCGGSVDTDDEGLFLQVIKGLVDVKNQAGSTVVAKGNQLYIPLPDARPVKKVIAPGVLEPLPEVVESVPEEESTSWWWYVLGVVLIAAVL